MQVGKEEIFIAAIKENEEIIFKIASVYTDTVDDKSDLVQEIIYQLWKSFDTFKQKSSLSTWMYRVALNVAIYQLNKSKKKIATVPLNGKALNLYDNDNNATEERLQLFKQQLDKLNLLEKGIVLLYLENKSYAEIAAITGISESNVGTKLSRIKEKLKAQISK